MKVQEILKEVASAGTTNTNSVGTIENPGYSPGKARGKKSYLGSPTTGSGTKAPPQPKVKQPKNADGTAKNGLESDNLFGGSTIKRR